MINKIKILVTGKNISYFLKEIIRNKINIYNIDKYDNELYLTIDYKDLKKILDIKTICKIEIVERIGINKYKYLIKKYLFLIIFLLIGIIINIVLSNIIFKIEIKHPNKEIVKTIKKDLEKYNIKKYHFVVSYKRKEYIKKQILLLEKEKIEWLEIDRIGTKYVVRIEERKINEKEKECIPRNIVAKKKSIVMEIYSSTGEIVKKKNDYVDKGEIIISGLIHNKDKIVSKRCSIGKVYGETWYNVNVSIPKEIKKEILLNDKEYGLNINIFNINLNLHNKLRTYKKYEYNIINSKIIPLKISIVKRIKTKIIKEIYTEDNIDEIALKESLKEIKKKLKNDEEVISKKVLKKTEKNSKIEVEVFYKVKENITSYEDISDLSIEEMNEKKE